MQKSKINAGITKNIGYGNQVQNIKQKSDKSLSAILKYAVKLVKNSQTTGLELSHHLTTCFAKHYMLRPMQTDTTSQNIVAYCCVLLAIKVASVCMGLKFDRFQTIRNKWQHCCGSIQTDSTC